LPATGQSRIVAMVDRYAFKTRASMQEPAAVVAACLDLGRRPAEGAPVRVRYVAPELRPHPRDWAGAQTRRWPRRAAADPAREVGGEGVPAGSALTSLRRRGGKDEISPCCQSASLSRKN